MLRATGFVAAGNERQRVIGVKQRFVEIWKCVAMSRFGALIAAMFRERELILRVDGEIRYLRLTRPLQIAAASLATLAFAWFVGMTVLWDLQRDVIAAKNFEIKDSGIAYEKLLDDVLAYQKKVARATGKLRGKHAYLLRQMSDGEPGSVAVGGVVKKPRKAPVDSDEAFEARQSLRLHLTQVDIELEQMTETTNLLEGSLNKVKARLARAEQERESIARKGNSLQDQVRELQDNLVTARARAGRLDRLKKDIEGSLLRARESYSKVVEERTGLERRKRELENDLGASRQRGDKLQGEVTKLAQDLDQSREKIVTVVGHRSVLQALVSRLEKQLQGAETQIGRLEKDFRSVIGRLQKATGGRDGANGDLAGAEKPFSEQANILFGQLAELQTSQETILDQLRKRTSRNVVEAEQVIRMTGLDLAKIIKGAGGLPACLGGPLIASEAANGTEAVLASTVHDLDNHLSRWEILRSALRSMPLISPVDFYHVASHYGKRRDPITRRRAMHFGVDLAGWRKAPVYSAASGKVVFAGRKGRFGKMVEVDHGNGIRTRYGHLDRISVRKGRKISHRTKIGLLGSTGRSTGPHVHYEILFNGKHLDPLKFIKAGRHVFKEPKAATKKPKRKRKKGTG